MAEQRFPRGEPGPCNEEYFEDWRDERIRELEQQLAELQWQPITPENLPKVGDEAYSSNDGDFLEVHTCDLGTFQEWSNEGWTHFRAINPPTQDKLEVEHEI